MTLYGILIFLIAWVAGWIAIRSISVSKNLLAFFLTFSGAYLFSITVVHILPEVFESSHNVTMMGTIILAGFFMQQILEYFSNGAEHGHLHDISHNHTHSSSFLWVVTAALFIHSFLEGTLLTDSHGDSIFLGVFIHKAPAAFAFVSILICNTSSRKKIFFFLLLFSMASPLGMIFSSLFATEAIQPILFGLVAGSFLQISTTIVFESSADHRFNLRKLVFSLSGAVLAVLSELFFLS